MLDKRLSALAAQVTTILGREQVRGTVWVIFTWRHARWTAVVLGAVPIGLPCRQEHLLRSNTCLSLASGRMVGSTSRLSLPSTTFGRPSYLPNHAPRTRPIYVHTSEQGPVTFCAGVLLHLNSGSYPWCSGRSCARGCGCHYC